MLYNGDSLKADTFSETGRIIAETLQTNLCIANTYTAGTVQNANLLAHTQRDWRFFCKGKVLTTKTRTITTWYIRSAYYLQLFIFYMRLYPRQCSLFSKKPVFNRNLRPIVCTAMQSFTNNNR